MASAARGSAKIESLENHPAPTSVLSRENGRARTKFVGSPASSERQTEPFQAATPRAGAPPAYLKQPEATRSESCTARADTQPSSPPPRAVQDSPSHTAIPGVSLVPECVKEPPATSAPSKRASDWTQS
jgi:hypothetical protein